MQIKEMFVKPIDRELQGVIFAGQDANANVKQELEEYVVTAELQKHFADFYKAYMKGIEGKTPKMGVWISGFFGSGKSHFLKILSYLLENKEVDGKRAIDYFIDDNKIKSNTVVEQMKKAAAVPSDVILFNIDAKGKANGEQKKDTIINVFLRVFNEMQGFCGSMPALADFERKLTEENKYEEFKANYKAATGEEWENARNDFDFIQDDFVDVLVGMKRFTEAAARNLCERVVSPYEISIEDFALRIKKYLVQKGTNHHIIFLVDEAGQYIGDNSQMMLNLQTVTEELGMKCEGKAWIIVTSQQDIDSVTKVKGNDFSKIQGRFDTRLALSSANVDDIIKKRILEKRDSAVSLLKGVYEKEKTVIKNLIMFNDPVQKKLYDNADNFAALYPFVSYQFMLLSHVLTSVREHGAAGKHLAGGERSMLAMFKEAAMACMYEEEGVIVPFHYFYDAMENFLDHSHRSVIIQAYSNDFINPQKKMQGEDVFEINVLKTLFMIKYVNKITATLDNITSLMVSNVNDDRIELKAKVEAALKVLMQQMLVQKNADIYIFLTNEEQEINREINSEIVGTDELNHKVSELLFEDLLRDNRYRYPEFNGRYTFAFNQFVDDRPYKTNQNHNIGLRILTSYYDGPVDEQSLRMKSGQANEVIVVLQDKLGFMNEIQTYLQIEKFLRRSTGNTIVAYEKIHTAKRTEMAERSKNARSYLEEALKDADIYVNGDLDNTRSKEIRSRINEALGKLVIQVYNKLPYIDTAMDEIEVRKMIVDDQQIKLLDDGVFANNNALTDVKLFIGRNTADHKKTSMKSLKDRFMQAPYGFVDDDIHWLVAALFKQGEITFTMNSAPVSLLTKSHVEILNFITKKSFVEKLLMERRIKVNETEKKAVKLILKELFKDNNPSDDEDVLMNQFRNLATNKLQLLSNLAVYYEANGRYPGKDIVENGSSLLKDILQISVPVEFFKKAKTKQDKFFDLAEDLIPVQDFFKGDQKKIFDNAYEKINIYDDSKEYIADTELENIVTEIKGILQKPKPYSDIPKLPSLIDKYLNKYNEILEKEAKPVLYSIEECKNRVMEELETKEYKAIKINNYRTRFDSLKQGAEACNNVSRLRGYADKASALREALLQEMANEDAKRAIVQPEPVKPVKPGIKVAPVIQPKPKKIKIVRIKTLAGTSVWRVEKEADIDKVIDSLRNKIKNELKDNTVLQIEL